MLFPPPEDFGYRVFLVGAAVFNLLLSLFSEMVLSDTLVRKAVNRKDKAYELVNKELSLQPKWPPISPPSDGAAESNSEQSSGEDSQAIAQLPSYWYLVWMQLFQVIVTETDPAQSSEQAFNSLFNTPSSSIHSAAAVSLNPSTTPLRKPPGQGIIANFLVYWITDNSNPGRNARSRAGSSLPTSQWRKKWPSSPHGTILRHRSGNFSKIFNSATKSSHNGKSKQPCWRIQQLLRSFCLLWPAWFNLWRCGSVTRPRLNAFLVWHIYTYILEQLDIQCNSRRFYMIYGAILDNHCDIQCHKHLLSWNMSFCTNSTMTALC